MKSPLFLILLAFATIRSSDNPELERQKEELKKEIRCA